MSHLKPDEYVPQAIRTSFWQPSPTEDEDMVLASSKTKPLVSVLSSLTKIGDDQIRRKIEQNEDVIENDYSNTVHSVLNCFKKRMNVIEECELFDESDDDYEIDVDKLIESENSLSEKFRKRSEDPNFYRDYNGEGSLHSDKASAMSNRSKGVIPIEKSTGPIFGSHKRIDEVTYKNYINAKKPSTLVVSKVQGLQPRIDTTGVPLRENERYKKFEDYVIDKKKQAEEDHRMKDFRKSPYSVTNIIKVTCKKKSNDAEKLQKEKNNDRTIQKSQRKNIVSTCATKTRKRVKKVVEHHHHYYKDGQVVHTEVTTSPQVPPVVIEEPRNITHSTTSTDHATHIANQLSSTSTGKTLDHTLSETSSQKSLSTHSKMSIEPISIPTEATIESAHFPNEQEKENIHVNNSSNERSSHDQTNSVTLTEGNPEKLKVVSKAKEDSKDQKKETTSKLLSDTLVHKPTTNVFSSVEIKHEKQPPIKLLKQKETTSEEEHKKKVLNNNIESILSNRKDDHSIDLKLKRFLKKRERKKQKNKRLSSSNPLLQSSTSLQSSKAISSCLSSSRTFNHVREVLKQLDFSKVKSLPTEKKLTIDDVHPYHVASLSTPKEISDFVETAELSVYKILKQIELVPENEESSKNKHVADKLLRSQLESIKQLAKQVTEAYSIATEKCNSQHNTEFPHDEELDLFAQSTKFHETTVKANIKGHSYPHSMDEYNKRKSAGVEGSYQSVIEKKQEELPSRSLPNNHVTKRPASAPPKGQVVRKATTTAVKGPKPTNSLKNSMSKHGARDDTTVTPTSKNSKFKRPLRIEIEKNEESTHVVEEEVVNSPPSSPEQGEDLERSKSTYFNLNSSVEENNIEVNPYF